MFSSPAIEAHLHRIPGLSKKFIYFNDDVFLGAPTMPEDFLSVSGSQKFHLAWDVPKCAPGCSDAWIGDGFCDRACNVSSCDFDFPDCMNATSTSLHGSTVNGQKDSNPFCSKGCPDSWLGDKVCDARCNNMECAWDMGDCGLGLVMRDFPGIHLTRDNTHEMDFIPSSLVGSSFNRSTFVVKDDVSSNKSFDIQVGTSFTPLGKTSVPVAISVPIGTKAVYFNMTLLKFTIGTEAMVNNTFFVMANHTPSDIVHNAVVLTRHDLLLVTLYSEQDDAPKIPDLPHHIYFDVLMKNALTNVSANIEFVLEVMPNGAASFNKMGYPVNAGPMQGFSAVCSSSLLNSELLLRKSEIAERPFSVSNWGADLRNESVVGIGLILTIQHTYPKFSALPTNKVIVRYKMSSYTRVFETTISICDAIGSVSSGSFMFQRHYADGSCPDTLGALIRQQAEIPTHNDLSMQFDPHSRTPISNLAGDEVASLTLLVPVPAKWANLRRQWIHSSIYIMIAENDTSRTDHFSKIERGGKYQQRFTKRNKSTMFFMNELQRDEVSEATNRTLLCASASFQWGKSNTSSHHITSHHNSSILSPLDESLLKSGNTPSRKMTRRRRLEEDTYAQSLIFVNRLYTKKFGPEPRKVPAHSPHLIDRDAVQEMQDLWSREWNATSSNKFRSRSDMQYAFSYYYYMMNRHTIQDIDVKKIIEEEVDTDRDGLINDNEFRTLTAIARADIEVLHNCTLNASGGALEFSENLTEELSYGRAERTIRINAWPSINDVMACELVVKGIRENIDRKLYFQAHSTTSDKNIAFEMIGDNYTATLSQLDSIRTRQSKFICINDNMKNPSPKLLQALRDFFEAFWPIPSKFELPKGKSNPVLRYDEYILFQEKQYVKISHKSASIYHKILWAWNFMLKRFDLIGSSFENVLVSTQKNCLKKLRHFFYNVLDAIEALLTDDAVQIRERQAMADIRKFRDHVQNEKLTWDYFVIISSAVLALCGIVLMSRSKRN